MKSSSAFGAAALLCIWVRTSVISETLLNSLGSRLWLNYTIRSSWIRWYNLVLNQSWRNWLALKLATEGLAIASSSALSFCRSGSCLQMSCSPSVPLAVSLSFGCSSSTSQIVFSPSTLRSFSSLSFFYRSVFKGCSLTTGSKSLCGDLSGELRSNVTLLESSFGAGSS